MPLDLAPDAPTLLIRKEAFERAALTRAGIDTWLNLTPDEFRVEGQLVAIGPVHDDEGLQSLVAALESKGMSYFDDFFEMPGNWPAWMKVVAISSGTS
jgi:hypothetical protein